MLASCYILHVAVSSAGCKIFKFGRKLEKYFMSIKSFLIATTAVIALVAGTAATAQDTDNRGNGLGNGNGNGGAPGDAIAFINSNPDISGRRAQTAQRSESTPRRSRNSGRTRNSRR